MSILADTNILLRRTQPDHPAHAVAVESVARLLSAGETVYYTLQNISEYWNVLTRPTVNNGMGFSAAVALRELERIEVLLTLLPDPPALYAEWRRLVVSYRVLGSKVHDAKLVAVMRLHDIRRILTFNTNDFTRYDVEAVHPESVLSL